jgi:hypothetical protein
MIIKDKKNIRLAKKLGISFIELALNHLAQSDPYYNRGIKALSIEVLN